MPAEVIDGQRIAADMCAELGPRVAALTDAGVSPGFVVLVVGDDPLERRHAERKMRVCAAMGVFGRTVALPGRSSEADVVEAVDRLNRDDRVHGILVQLPLPTHVDALRVLQRVEPRKDVDGYHLLNEGRVLMGRADGRARAAALAIQQMLLRSGLVVRGAHAVVLGHGDAVARPVATLLGQDGPGGGVAVTLCPVWTQDLAAITRTAHVLITAVGRPAFVSADMVRPGAVVIDAGAHVIARPEPDRGFRIVGDVKFDEVRAVARAISPVPGGVGPVTIAALLHNTVETAESWLRN